MSHDAKVGSVMRYDRALRTLAEAQRREAAACEKFADLLEAASLCASERAGALREAAKASRTVASAIEDHEEAERTMRQSELLMQQSRQADAESMAQVMRAKASRAEADRARAQADTNDSFALRPPKSRGGRRGG